MLIGISGLAGSGKSEVAKILREKHGYTEKSFAQHLKELCREIFFLTEWHTDTQEGKMHELDCPIVFDWDHRIELWEKYQSWKKRYEKGPVWRGRDFDEKFFNLMYSSRTFYTTREVLQFVGTEICRDIFDAEFHTKILEDTLGENVVFSDARFPNEREAISKRGGKLILVQSTNTEVLAPRHASEESLGHICEYDFVLFNDPDQGLDNLATRVDFMVKSLFAADKEK